MSERRSFTTGQGRAAREAIGIDRGSAPFDVEQLRMGVDVELERGLLDSATTVTGSVPILEARIALAHLDEFPVDNTRPRRRETGPECEQGGAA